MTPFFGAWVGAHLRDLPLARRAGNEGGAACEEGRFRMWGAVAKLIGGGWARTLQGEGHAGVAEASEALLLWEQTGARMLRSFFLGLVGEAHLAAADSVEALAVVERALAVSRSSASISTTPSCTASAVSYWPPSIPSRTAAATESLR